MSAIEIAIYAAVFVCWPLSRALAAHRLNQRINAVWHKQAEENHRMFEAARAELGEQ